jgi:hypothetical protein
MASFELPRGGRLQFLKNASGEGIVWLHTGVEIKLDLVAPPAPTGADLRDVVSSKPAVSVAVVARSAAKLTFSVKASGPEVAEITGKDKLGHEAAKLVVVAGDFKNHPGMEIDLLANVCRGSDPVKTVQIQRLLFNDPENVFDQHSAANEAKFGEWGCGFVAKAGAEEVFGVISILTYKVAYHEPLDKVTDRTDVRYTAETILRVELAIRALLARGVPVRVGVLDSPVGMPVHDHKLVATDSGGHTVLIVGCNRNSSEFLYIDPWGGPPRTHKGKFVQFTGSKMKYEGGIAGAMPTDECLYMGMFVAKYYSTRAVKPSGFFPDFAEKFGWPNILRQKRSTENGFNTLSGTYLEIVSGPPI